MGRYVLHEPLASGGMATVHLGRIVGVSGFARTVAIKRLREEHAGSADLMTMLLDEAHIAARIRHPNVVPTLDAFVDEGEIFVVMEYVLGASLQEATAEPARPVPISIAVRVVSDVLAGLAAAHETRSAEGEPLDVVHRDVSPQNIVLGIDGSARVLDFGIAKARGRSQTTRDGQLKGKLAYMAPEQTRGGAVSPATDVFATGIVLYELLTGERLFRGDNEAHTLANVLHKAVPPPRSLRPEIPVTLERVVLQALERDPARRFPTARAMGKLLDLHPAATRDELTRWVEAHCGPLIEARRRRLQELESTPEVDAEASPVAVAAGDLVETRVDAASPSRPTSAARPPRPRSAVVVAALLLVGGVALAVRAVGSREGAAAPPAASVEASLPTVPSAPSSVGTGVDAASPADGAVTFVVQTTPAGATVTFGGESLGATPVRAVVPRSLEIRELRVEARGYAAWTANVAPDRDRDYVLTLKPTALPGARPSARPREPEVRRFD